MKPSLPTILATVLSTFSVDCALAGGVHRVGPTRAHRTIQAAIDAASDGDTVLVDAGRYAPFEVLAKGLLIASAKPEEPFTILASRQSPAVRVWLLTANQTTTVMGWRTNVEFGDMAPVAISHCRGVVRMRDAVLTPTANLENAAMNGIIDVRDCALVTLTDVSTGSNLRFTGRRAVGIATKTGLDRGLSAVHVRDSTIHLQRCALQGYPNIGTIAKGRWGGDAVRLTGSCRAQIDESGTLLRGGFGGEFGGSCVHAIASKLPRVRSCGITGASLRRGFGPAPGGAFAHNHDRGVLAAGGDREVPSCTSASYGSLHAPARFAIGTNANIKVHSAQVRQFTLVVGPTGFGELPGIQNTLHIELNSAYTGVVAWDWIPLAKPKIIEVSVPRSPILIGLQLSVQALLAPTRSAPSYSLSLAETVVITP